MGTLTDTFVAAALQMRSTRDVAENTAALLAMAEEAVGRGATFLQSPEISNLCERDKAQLAQKLRPESEDGMLAAIRAFAARRKVHFHIGSLALKEGDKFVNRGFLVAPDGSIAARYDKLHLFDVDLPNGESWRESASYHAGREAVVTPAGTAVLGMTICYDIRFPYLYRALAEAGADILSAPACFTRQTGEAHWSVLQRARAIENGAFMISAAQGGKHEDGRESYGHSIIVDPWGKVLAEGGAEPGVILAEIDLARVAEARARIPALRHTRAISVSRQGFAPEKAAE
ncbi:MAG: carbon-nitrogen hydrolase family protein [Proteobacteria bacterium]|nr:carbon-nitrogen hydrolase family protein [Pseudomonadota bacterium]